MSQIGVSIDGFGVGLVELESAATRNALTPEMKAALIAALEGLDANPEVRCVVLAGSEQVFAAGADVAQLAAQSLDAPADEARDAFWTRLAAIETPLVAAVSGYALGGGCELALACDMVVAHKDARFGLPEVTLGLIPGGGGTQRLTRAIGKQRAMEYVLTGRRFDAETALAWGLVNRTSRRNRWREDAIELARTVAARAPIATRLGKRAVLAADEVGLAAGLERERELFDEAMATEDRIEGTTAFLEQREPQFKGR